VYEQSSFIEASEVSKAFFYLLQQEAK